MRLMSAEFCDGGASLVREKSKPCPRRRKGSREEVWGGEINKNTQVPSTMSATRDRRSARKPALIQDTVYMVKHHIWVLLGSI